MPQNTERIAIDLKNWQGKTKQEILQDLASFPIESANANLKDRVNVNAIKLSEFGRLIKRGSKEPEDLATEKIYNWAKNSSPFISLIIPSRILTESEILSSMKEFIDFNPGQVMLWLSPAEKGIYDESRIGIYQTLTVNGEKYLFFRSLCGTQDSKHCSQIISRCLPYSIKTVNLPIPDNPNSIRENPITIGIKDTSYIGFLSTLIDDIPGVWEHILSGKDIETKIQTSQVSPDILSDQLYEQIQQAKTFSQQVRLGTYLEQELQHRLNITLKSGSCGVLYSSINTNPLTTVLGISPTNSEGGKRKHCGRCGKTGYFTEGESCPYNNSSKN